MVQPLRVPSTPPPRNRPLRYILYNWLLRHRHPINFPIHLVAIPTTVVGVMLLFFVPWYWGVAAFVLGYLLQYVGHIVEGNDLGEWAGIKKMLGLPYVDMSPRWKEATETEPSPAA